MTANERLGFIQARLNEAMPGPWEFDGLTVSQAADNYAEVIPTDVNCSSYCYGGSVRGPGKPDAEFIANAPTDIAFLLDPARKQQAALAAALALAEEWRYKGEYGWGAWQEGHGPDPEGYALDGASADLRAAISDALGADQ